MNILYFNPYFSTEKGAYGTRAYEFTRRWVQKGDTVTVVTAAYDRSDLRVNGWIDKQVIDGVNIIAIQLGVSNQQSTTARFGTFLIYGLFSVWYALVAPCDVVLCSSGPLTSGIPGLVAGFFRRKPFVFEVRDLLPDGAIELGLIRNPALIWMLRSFERACYRRASRIIALSIGMAQWITAKHGFEHITVVTNASDPAVADAAAMPVLPQRLRGKPMAIYAGAFGFAQNCEQMIEVAGAVDQLDPSGVQIVLIGSGKYAQQLREAAQSRGLENIHFIGQISREDVFGWLKQSICTIVFWRASPILDTTSPNKMFDAFAAGIPVVHDTQGWIKDLLTSENCGITAERGSAMSMAESIVRLSRNESLRREMAENSRRLGRERFERGLLAENARQVLHEALERR